MACGCFMMFFLSLFGKTGLTPLDVAGGRTSSMETPFVSAEASTPTVTNQLRISMSRCGVTGIWQDFFGHLGNPNCKRQKNICLEREFVCGKLIVLSVLVAMGISLSLHCSQ